MASHWLLQALPAIDTFTVRRFFDSDLYVAAMLGSYRW
jgi:hypothetical protein